MTSTETIPGQQPLEFSHKISNPTLEHDDPCSCTETDLSLVDPLIRWVKRKQLATPATLFLEMNRPLMPLAFPAALMFGGLLAPLCGPDYYSKAEALRDPHLLDRILARLADRDGPEATDSGKEAST